MHSEGDHGAVSNVPAKIQLNGGQHSNRPNLVEVEQCCLLDISRRSHPNFFASYSDQQLLLIDCSPMRQFG
jgi:hypothetical protein